MNKEKKYSKNIMMNKDVILIINLIIIEDDEKVPQGYL